MISRLETMCHPLKLESLLHCTVIVIRLLLRSVKRWGRNFLLMMLMIYGKLLT